MLSNWSKLKRKLDNDKKDNKTNKLHPKKRRRVVHVNKNKALSKNESSSNYNHKKNKNAQSSLSKYSNSLNNNNEFDKKIEKYRNSTSRADLFSLINLIPPSNTNNNIAKRKEFWNNLRLKLRARLPKEFLFKLITPINNYLNPNHSDKLHEIKANISVTNLVAIDCEMVGIGYNGNKSILARISIINYYGDVLYDKFIKPTNKITDYRTNITGIVKNDLIKYGIDFNCAQKEIIQILSGKKIVGHAIENDFNVLKCKETLKNNYYKQIIKNNDNNKNSKKKMSKRKLKKTLQKGYKDNSWYFDTATCSLLHDNLNKPRSLKFLLELYLGIHIQDDIHDSVIDAIATMAIYRSILAEINSLKKNKLIKKKEILKNKNEYLKKKNEEYQLRQIKRRNLNLIRNYAYDNSLDKLMNKFNYLSKDLDADNVSLNTNPYKNELFTIDDDDVKINNDNDQDDDLLAFLDT